MKDDEAEAPASHINASMPAAAPSVGGALRTMALLEFVARMPRPVSPTDIARGTSMNPSTAFNLTRTLATAGYLQPVAGTRLYTIGPAMHTLLRQIANQPRPYELARLPMQAFANRYEVVVSLWRRSSRYSMMLLVAAESEAATRIQVSAGVDFPLLHGSIGRIMAIEAELSDEERRQVFKVVNFERPVSYRTFMGQAKVAAARGWSLDDGNVRKAVTSVSVPLRTGAATDYVCTATMFRHQHEGAALEALAAELCRLAETIAPGLASPSA